MKKLIMALCLAGSVCAFSQTAEAGKVEGGPRPAAGERPRLTPEQRKERFEKFRAERKARYEAAQAKVVETLKEAGLDEAKAKETAAKIEKIFGELRRPPMNHPGFQGGPRGPHGGPRGPHRGHHGRHNKQNAPANN